MNNIEEVESTKLSGDSLATLPMAVFDLRSSLDKIKNDGPWKSGKRGSITLLNSREMRIVLVALQANASIQSHQVDSPFSLQMIEGEIEFRAGSSATPLKEGDLITVQPQTRHDIRALKESAFLLTLAANQAHPIEK